MKLTTHNTEQATRAFVTFELARKGYLVQPTDSRFPSEDLLVVSPSGKHFGIDVKGQKTKNFWQIKQPIPHEELFYFLVYMPSEGIPDVYILSSIELLKLWKEYKKRTLDRGRPDDGRWGINWATPFPYKDNWGIIPQ